MAKKESNLINMVVSLGTIALIASATLGFMYELTKAPIEQARQKKLNQAIELVTPKFDNQPGNEKYDLPIEADEPLVCYPARHGGALVGTAVRTYSDMGFTRRIYIMVGFDASGKIINTSVLDHAETPGLGDKMEKKKSPWSEQFNNKDPKEYKLKVKKDGGDVDAITAATISSRAFTDAVDRAYNAYMKGGKHE